ncbi:5-(carboxyamino)imidazole ribonucleotide synthase [Jeotgalibacillus haloalkalitolerans]|uniref:N5-carboxyaminoimidazole ribonucleotide synthase n=1 Tax=Jeotgalibacillus haloalkalitolerans TaxID=3104292 RepID=A0ABU5KQJ2_9BACL|nr:5-(carboxyamino)imidazole ribonucleotide synthase [Jeotgalibacillus sp. HH7-29]MDZ5713509.1 5-(carboxyamino)imidazole ribonucleotide synthase [Jeotgalibacillus sp. HH7-29]
MKQMILPPAVIGIIGGGQLGRMMALAAKEAGFKIAVLDPSENGPCAQVADYVIQTAYDDEKGLAELAELSDVITYEFENIDYESLKRLSGKAHVPQGAELIRITQNRQFEKDTLTKADVPTASYKIIENEQQLYDMIGTFVFPMLLKTITGGYDGKGQVKLESEEDLPEAAQLIKLNGTCILEAFVDFDCEISVIIHRNEKGETVTQPIAENIHEHQILHTSIVPARVSEEVKANAIRLAEQVADQLQLIGTLAVEMFVGKAGELYVNELAPRPHNSGHYSIEASSSSQFHQHIRSITNWPLPSSDLLKSAVMVNLLGQHVEPALDAIAHYPHWSLHLYGKDEAKTNRKMGHITILTDDIEKTLKEIEASGVWSPVKEAQQ